MVLLHKSDYVHMNDTFYFCCLCLNNILLYIYLTCVDKETSILGCSSILSKIEKQNAQASTFLIKVQSIHHTNNDKKIDVCHFNWRP